jgi:pantothenate kinase
MNRKGFPESYDTRALLKFLRDLKSGQAVVEDGLSARHLDPRRSQRSSGRQSDERTCRIRLGLLRLLDLHRC